MRPRSLDDLIESCVIYSALGHCFSTFNRIQRMDWNTLVVGDGGLCSSAVHLHLCRLDFKSRYPWTQISFAHLGLAQRSAL